MLEVNNLTKTYGQLKALDNVSFSLNHGIYGLLGPNGAGKSTLMNILTLSLSADTGTVTWNGKPILKMGADYRKLLGFMPQQQGLYDGFTGFDFLNYMAVLKNIPKQQIKEEINRVAEFTNLKEKLKDRISEYSGGMKQRLLLAAAVLGNPEFIILDEPTAGLDPKERIRTRHLIQSVAKDKIVLIATHIVSDIESIADEILLMKDGHLIKKDSYNALCETYGEGKGLEGVYMHFFADEDSYAFDKI